MTSSITVYLYYSNQVSILCPGCLCHSFTLMSLSSTHDLEVSFLRQFSYLSQLGLAGMLQD